MLNSVPIYAVTVDNVGERGAHFVAYQEYQKLKQATVGSIPKGSAVSGKADTVLGDCSVTGCEKCLCSKTNVVGAVITAALFALGAFASKR
jgi:hypothetical protein